MYEVCVVMYEVCVAMYEVCVVMYEVCVVLYEVCVVMYAMILYLLNCLKLTRYHLYIYVTWLGTMHFNKNGWGNNYFMDPNLPC